MATVMVMGLKSSAILAEGVVVIIVSRVRVLRSLFIVQVICTPPPPIPLAFRNNVCPAKG